MTDEPTPPDEPTPDPAARQWVEEFSGRANSLLSQLDPGTRRHVVNRHQYDIKEWERASTDPTLPLRQMVSDYSETEDAAVDLLADLFHLLRKAEPTLARQVEMAPAQRPNHPLVSEFAAAESVRELRQHTIGDTYATAMAISSMDSEIALAYEKQRLERQRAEEEAEALRQAMEALAEILEALQNEDPTEEQKKQLEQMLAELDEHELSDPSLPPMGALLDAAQQAADALAAEMQRFRSYGAEPGEVKAMDFAQRRRLAEVLNRDKMRMFADLVGPFARLANVETRRKVNHLPDEVYSVEQSDRIHDLTPTEMLAMATPEQELDFFRRMASNQLLTYAKQGYERTGRGPKIVICDESGSMSGPGPVSGEMWSKAVALALADTCRREKRHFHYVGFASTHECYSIELTPNTPGVLDRVVEFVQHFYNGGTDFNAPLRKAIEICRQQHAANRRPDIVLVTDGSGHLSKETSEAWAQFRKASGARCHGLYVGAGHPPPLMYETCDTVRHVHDLTDSNQHLIDLFRTV